MKDPVSLFTGREEELKDLHAKILGSSENPTGGIGKTELVRQYIKKYSESFPDIVWFNAENNDILAATFNTLAKDTLRILSTRMAKENVCLYLIMPKGISI